MPKLTFATVPHTIIPGRQVVEVRIDDSVCAVITAGDDQLSIRVSSAHFTGSGGQEDLPKGVTMAPKTLVPVPVLQIAFDPRPFTIENGELKRSKIN